MGSANSRKRSLWITTEFVLLALAAQVSTENHGSLDAREVSASRVTVEWRSQ